MRKSSNYYRNK